ncbi:hypothetical protein CDEF62S_04857 [Castellaniella defragrans]
MEIGKQSKRDFTVSFVGVELVVSAILFLVGLAIIFDSYRIGAGWSGGNLQSGYFPMRLGIIISAVSTVIFVRTVFKRSKIVEGFVTNTELVRVMAVLIPTVLYVVGIQFFGIYVSSALFIGAFMRIGGKQGWFKTILISVGTSVALFVLFEVIFLIPLPKGPLESFLGY